MMGRYGMDQLNLALVLGAFGLEVVSIFTLHAILSTAAFALLIWELVRTFSRNIAARRRENEKFLRITARVRAFFAGFRASMNDRKTHRIYRCPSCGQKVRVPKHRGRVRITCPQCGAKFERKT